MSNWRTLASSGCEEWALLPRYLHWLGPAPRLEALSALLLPLRPLLRPRAAAGQDVVQVRALVVCNIVVIYTDSTIQHCQTWLFRDLTSLVNILSTLI